MTRRPAVWKKLIWGRLAVPDTWEVALSSAWATARDKREAWERLLRREQAGCAGAASQPAQHARGRSGREARALGARGQ